MFQERVLRFLSLATALAMLALPLPVLAEDSFATGWEAKPLVDPTAPAPAASATPEPAQTAQAQPSQPPAPRLEEVLKPAVPFIESVEGKLYLKPKTGEPLANRLNNIQTVLFGEVKYHDAGELLAKMAELFPAEAAKARADLLAQMKQQMPPPKQAVPQGQQMAMQAPVMANQPIETYPPANPKQAKKKKDSFWGDDDDFFSDDDWNREFSSAQPARPRGSGLAGFGAGLMNLATIAGSLAGSYYLNRNMGGNNGFMYRDPYGSPYYYNGYGHPAMYGYGYPYYGNGNNNFGNWGYAPFYGGQYYPMNRMTQSNTFNRIRPGASGLGVPF